MVFNGGTFPNNLMPRHLSKKIWVTDRLCKQDVINEMKLLL